VTDHTRNAIARLIIRVPAICVVLRNPMQAGLEVSYECWWSGRVSLNQSISPHGWSPSAQLGQDRVGYWKS
jgi:hypothetical protein